MLPSANIMAIPSKSTSLRLLPSVDRLLRTEQALQLRDCIGLERLTALARKVTDDLREELKTGRFGQLAGERLKDELLNRAITKLKQEAEQENRTGIRRVINATGVILHTNLGRAPLAEVARKAIDDATGYCTLEYDTQTGTRGKRGLRVEELLIQLTGAEDALVVNNCAAAALLILKVLAAGGETIVSRGELIEIGGDFRIPEVMANSGTRMVEVGSTNRTRLDDYKCAITDQTRLIMRVHPSNYRIIGFTTTPPLTDLAQCAHENDLLMYEDAGSGVLFDLSEYGLGDEPVIKNRVAQGADVVSFSGDKLLGSAQAGLIVGRRDVVERLRRHSLYRALRADKLCLAALEATLKAHVRGTSFSEVPALQMLSASKQELTARANGLLTQLADMEGSVLRLRLVEGQSAIGGGCGPNTHPETILIALEHINYSAEELEKRLRSWEPPIICRVANDQVLLDVRTIQPSDEADVVQALRTAF